MLRADAKKAKEAQRLRLMVVLAYSQGVTKGREEMQAQLDKEREAHYQQIENVSAAISNLVSKVGDLDQTAVKNEISALAAKVDTLDTSMHEVELLE